MEKYLLGSDKDLEFDVIVSNLGEDSFETTFEIKYPERIFYKKTESKPNMPAILCSPSENRTVICDIGNPLPSGKIVSTFLDSKTRPSLYPRVNSRQPSRCSSSLTKRRAWRLVTSSMSSSTVPTRKPKRRERTITNISRLAFGLTLLWN